MINTLIPKNIACKVVYKTSSTPCVHDAEIHEISNFSKNRKIEFLNGRHCAHIAMTSLGYSPNVAILPGKNREPLWPKNLVGSITHCEGYYAATVSFKKDIIGIGIDSEVNTKLSNKLLVTTQTKFEISRNKKLHTLVEQYCVNKLIFSAKESVFKFIYPRIQRYINFQDVEILLDIKDMSFSVDFIPAELNSQFNNLTLIGKFNFNSTHIVTCIYESAMN